MISSNNKNSAFEKKIRYRKNLKEVSPFISLFKTSAPALITITSDKILIKSKYGNNRIEISKIYQLQVVNPGNLNFEQWIEVSYDNQGKQEKIYMTPNGFFGVRLSDLYEQLLPFVENVPN